MSRWASTITVVLAAAAFAGCGDNLRGDRPDGGGIDQVPFACSRSFAASFEDLTITSGPFRALAFSGDCSRLLTIDDAQVLRVTDLVTRTTRIIVDDVYLALFADEAGERVLFNRQEETTYALFLATGGDIYPIDSGLQANIFTTPSGDAVAYLKDWDSSSLTADLRLAPLADLPPASYPIASEVTGSPSFSPDGETLIFTRQPIAHQQELAEYTCNWYTATLLSHDLASRSNRQVADDILAWSAKSSADSRRIYAASDYDCDKQTQSLVSYSVEGGEARQLVGGQPTYLSVKEMVEAPAFGELLHPVLLDSQQPAGYITELWATRTDGSGSETLAGDLMSSMQTCMYFVPFQLATEQVALYVRTESHELAAIDLASRDSWLIGSVDRSLFYAPSPDGQLVVSLAGDDSERFDLELTSLDGDDRQTLVAGATSGSSATWVAGGDRILALIVGDYSASRTLVGFDRSGRSQLIADDLPTDWSYGNFFAASPRGWLTAVITGEQLVVRMIP